MKLSEIVVKEAILPSLKATKCKDAVAELLEALVQSGAVSESNREAFQKARQIADQGRMPCTGRPSTITVREMFLAAVGPAGQLTGQPTSGPASPPAAW